MTRHILVTGGAGCIGSELVASLLAAGHRVTVLDNLSSGKLEHLAGVLGDPHLRFIHGDVLDHAAVEEAVEGAHFVFHLAANPDIKFREGDPTDRDLQQNVLATYNVLEAVRRHGIQKLAFSSTSAVYGLTEVLPIREDAAFPRPISLYGASKLSCEALISTFSHLFNIQCWIFRFANIVGAKVRAKGGTVISDFVEKLTQDPHRLQVLGDGNQAKSYLLVSECIDAMLFAVDRAKEPLNIFNLGCDDSLPVKRIAAMVIDAMGLTDVELSYTGTAGGWPGDVPRFVLDVSAINRLGWRAKQTSEQAVEYAIRALWKEKSCKQQFSQVG
jgi:UDP-glucose 4-epimerase